MNDTSSEQTQGAPLRAMKVDVSAVLGDKTKTGGETLSSCIDIENLNLFYSKDKQALIDINLTIPKPVSYPHLTLPTILRAHNSRS